MPLNLTLASRNLFHDRLRFVATMVGIVFSVVLVIVQMGLYLGFGQMVTKMISHASADLWVMRSGTKCFEDPSLLEASTRHAILAVPGVAEVSPLVVGFSDWRLPAGAMTPVFIVGADVHKDPLAPWDIAKGSVKALSEPQAVAVDLTYRKRLGVSKLGERAEIRGHSVRVAALTDGIRSFTTTPYVFTGLARARAYTDIAPSKTSYFLVKLEPHANATHITHELQNGLPDVTVLTPAQFSRRSRAFWLFGTGAGAALFAGALLGVIVGVVIVAQTLYSSTKDHLDEFATLRAMGSSNTYIHGVIIYQALLNALMGFGFASLIGFAIVVFTTGSSLPVVITPGLMAGVFALTVGMCVASAIVAILRVIRIEPAMVFTR